MLENKILLAEMCPAITSREIEDFIVQQIVSAGKRGGVIGLSGGIDSSTAAYAAKKGFERYNSEHPDERPLELHGLYLPSANNCLQSEEDAKKVAESLGIEFKVIDIEPILQARAKANPEIFSQEFHRGNGASRERMIQLYGFAADRELLVIGTGNKDEDYRLGYCTKYGDHGVDINPLGNLSKRLVRQLAKFYDIPERVQIKAPTAELVGNQTDEEDIGCKYEQAEIIINGKDQGLNPSEIANITGYSPHLVDKILQRHETNKHKTRMPPIADVTLVYR